MKIPEVEQTVRQYGLFASGGRVTVALSGGMDSVVLLHYLLQSARRWSITVNAVHINHGLRDTALRDETFCRELCKEWGVALTVHRISVREEAAKTGESLEMCGRRLRYALLRESADGGKIATAHHLNDQMETFFLNLLRGTGLKGLCGIPMMRDRVVRPLLFTQKSQLERYASASGLSYVEDETNASREFARNRIRMDLIPWLCQERPSFPDTFARTLQSLQEDESALQTLALESTSESLSVERLRQLPPAVERRVIAESAAEAGVPGLRETGQKAVRDLLQRGVGRVQISDGWFARIRKGRLEWVPPRSLQTADVSQAFREGIISTPIGEFLVSRTSFANREQKIHNLYFKSLVDCDKIGENPIFRTRRAGDSIALPGRGEKTLKKLLNEAGVPPEQRNQLLILSDDQGICYLEGFGPSQRCRITAETREAWRVERVNGLLPW